MKRHIALSSILFVFLTSTFAQEKPLATDKKWHYTAQFDAGFIAGSEQQVGKTFQIKNGVSFKDRYYAMAVLGFESFFTNQYSYFSQFTPMNLELRYDLLKGKTRPFVSGSVGYMQSLSRNMYLQNKGGINTGFKIGVTTFFTKNVGFQTSLGYRYIHLRQVQNAYDPWFLPYTEIESHLNRFELSIGLLFK